MDLRLEGRTVLITGASGGIGRSLAEVFGAEGANLVLHGHRQLAPLEAWARDQPWSPRALCVGADLGDPEAVQAMFDAGRHRFGRIGVCVANAGMWPRPEERLDQASVARIEDTVRVNLLGAAWTARAFMGTLAATGPEPGIGSSLTFIGSTAGRFGEAHHADYAMAKAGLVGLCRSLKNEIVALDPYGRVNVVEPGWTVTHMAREALSRPGVISKVCATMPLRQLGRAIDIARTVAFVASDMARHTSGEVITVAGGMEGRRLWGPDDVDEDAVRARLKG